MSSKKMRVFVAGHNGMVGSAIVRRLLAIGGIDIVTKARSELDLMNQSAVQEFFSKKCIDQVYIAAAKVGGIHANDTYPAEFIYENLVIESNIVHSAHLAGVKRLLFLGSSCIYPKYANQPIVEDELLTGKLEPTNEPYAIAKIAGIKLCESYNRQYGRDYRSIMPTNLYGPNDNFHPENSHVIPALIRRFHEAVTNQLESVDIWGSGEPRREFLHVDDLADACLHVMNLDPSEFWMAVSPMLSHINVGVGADISIRELAELIASIVGFEGDLTFDSSKPDGAPRKLLDVSKLDRLGWHSSISLSDGIQSTYNWYLKNGED